MGKTVKIWKTNGPEDQYIEKLINEGKLTKNTKPSELKNNHLKTFGDYSLAVIRNHLNILKGNHGLYLQADNDEAGIEEVGNFEINKQEFQKSENTLVEIKSGNQNVDYQNEPILIIPYNDVTTQIKKLYVAIVPPAGTGQHKFSLNECGDKLTLKYTWPKSMFDGNDLFEKQLKSEITQLEHLNIIAQMSSELTKYRNNVQEAPVGKMIIKLPFRVQTGVHSWSKSFKVKDNGTKIVCAYLSGYVEEYSRCEDDELVTLE